MASLVESLRHCNNSQKTSFKYLWELINPTTVQDNWGSVSGPWLSAETIPCWGIPFQKTLDQSGHTAAESTDLQHCLLATYWLQRLDQLADRLTDWHQEN